MERALVLVAHDKHSGHAPAVKWEAGEARVVAGCNLPSQSPSSHPILVFSFGCFVFCPGCTAEGRVVGLIVIAGQGEFWLCGFHFYSIA